MINVTISANAASFRISDRVNLTDLPNRRTNHRSCSTKKSVPKNFAIFTEKHLSCSFVKKCFNYAPPIPLTPGTH